MAIEVKPDTQRLVEDEIRSGHFASADELILKCVQAWRTLILPAEVAASSGERCKRAAGRIRAFRKGIRADRQGTSWRDYAHLDHRF
ncbi:MAG: hypothetical protein IPM24_19520 [Bryobacterales bacterium]|nr:hypothetical protein [Bryobacterales bacterium]